MVMTASSDTAPTTPAPRRLRVVIGVVVCVLVLAELGVRLVEHRLLPPHDWYTQEYGIKEEQMDALADAGGSSIVFIGSSVIDTTLDPSGLTAPGERPAYNAGLIGANLEMVDRWSELVVEPALRPDIVIIGISSRDVNANGAALETQTPGFYRLPAMRRLLGRESIAEQIERRAGELSRLVRYRTVLRRPLESIGGYDGPDRNVPLNDARGMELHLRESTFQGGEVVAEFFRNEPLLDFAVSDVQLGALRRAIDRLQRQGARVILLDVPVTEQYVSLHPDGAADYRAYEAALQDLAGDTGIELVDAGVWQQKALFSDPLHLNGVGSDTLTRLIDRYLVDGGLALPPGATDASATGG
jgi:hypothetical protein